MAALIPQIARNLFNCPAEMKEIKEIIMTDGIVFSKRLAYSLCKMNRSLNFFEELMRASFQYSSNKIKRHSIRIDSSDMSVQLKLSFISFLSG